MSIKRVAKVVVFNPDGKVLLMRRSSTDDRRPGGWDFPGGGVERGESFEKGAVRELREEAGLQANPNQLRLLYMATEYYRPRRESVNRVLFAMVLKTEREVTMSFEHEDYVWVSPEQAMADFPHPFYSVGLAYGLKHKLISL